ncbi:MAG TPA: hypothetical protein DIU00_14160 [Phycisphaerales bacterium]|nr:hypothetical protein [Phycisphaerales bacterium]
MPTKSAKILLTGLPGCGKTSAVMKIISSLECEKVAGFYTQEIRENRTRKGFGWKRLDGAGGILAHVDVKSRFKVGRYGVDIAGFEKDVVPVLDAEQTDTELFVIDEIGKMEMLSVPFREAVWEALESGERVLGTIMLHSNPLADEIKRHPGVTVIPVTRENHTEVMARLLGWLKKVEKS